MPNPNRVQATGFGSGRRGGVGRQTLARGLQLAQIQPSTTVAVTAIGTSLLRRQINCLVVTNTNLSSTFRLFHDDDGGTYGLATAMFYNVTIDDETTVLYQLDNWVMAPEATIGVRAADADRITFTFYGEYQEAV